MEDRRNLTAGTAAGTPITGLLGIAFIVLKLCGVIDWSWVWVLSPFWISALIVIFIILVFLVAVCIRKSR